MKGKRQGFDMEKEDFRYVGSRHLQKWTLAHETQQVEINLCDACRIGMHTFHQRFQKSLWPMKTGIESMMDRFHYLYLSW